MKIDGFTTPYLADLKDVRRTRQMQRQGMRSWAYVCAWAGLGALITGWNGSIGWWVLGAVLFGASAVIAFISSK
jgi:hypothetical protein